MYTQYEFKSVYRTPTGRRLHWLENDFLKYFQDWKDWAMGQEDVPLLEQKQYFISDQTWEGLQICVKSFVEVVKFLLIFQGSILLWPQSLIKIYWRNFSGNLGKRVEHMGHSHVRNLVRVIALCFQSITCN